MHDRLVVEAADAGDAEHDLRQHRAAEQEPDVEAGERDELASRPRAGAWPHTTRRSLNPWARAVRT